MQELIKWGMNVPIIWNFEKIFYNIFKFDWGVTSFHLSLISRFFLWLWSCRLSDWDARIWSTFIGLWIRNVISKGKMQNAVRYVHKDNEIWGQPCTVTESADFGFIPLLWRPQGPQGCLEKQNHSLSLNLVAWCAKIGPKT